MTRAAVLGIAGGAALAAAVPALALLGSAPTTSAVASAWTGDVARPSAAASDAPDDPAAVRALARAVTAAKDQAYTGRAVVWGWSLSSAHTVEVRRLPGTGTEVRVVDPSGHLGAGQLRADHSGPTGSPGDTGRTLGLLAQRYGVRLGPPDVVLDRVVDVVVARRGDGTDAARFWLDRRTGLVLRREVYDDAGGLVQAAAFTAISYRAPADRLAGVEETEPERPWTRMADPASVDALRMRGWLCPGALPRGLDLVDVRLGRVGDSDVLQMIYSDGLATVSLFEQRGRLDPDELGAMQPQQVAGTAVWTQPGGAALLVWQSGDAVMTLVADAPDDVVRGVVAALPGDPEPPGSFPDRVARGWQRLLQAVGWG
ncbi:MAG: hypothetical protein R2737_02730 [Candidatus Nanopelagicales bacterium]